MTPRWWIQLVEEDYLSIIVCDPKVVDIQLVEEDYLSIIDAI